MRELVIDVTRLLSRGLQGRLPTGVDRVSLEFLRHFGDRATALVRIAGRWVILNGTDSRRVFDELLAPSDSFGLVLRWCVGKGYALRWSAHAQCVLLNTGHSGLDQPDYAVQVRRRGMLPIFFLHDLIPLTHPEYCRAGEAAKHQQRLSTMIQEGRGLIVNSMDTQDTLERFASREGWPLPPCAVAHLAPATLLQPALARPVAEPYFVMLGTLEPRKNHLLILHLWRQLIGELGSAAPRLVIIGQRGWECEQVVDLLERCEILRSHVTEQSNCSDAELATWLTHSQALLFPSFVEGFGMPLVEALMLGVPVIASDLPVFQEIAANIPEYLDPLDGVGWRRVILDYAQAQSQLRQAQC
ncbi:glycosyltransferase family 4 protein, partial [Rhodoferax sp.]|uniref:glycosyltransferase family 4 protein n=1 Tax=Rhodoferax sp. TaxID=50421 RepID=UPI00276C2F1A|nr:glycosyltransferase family 1 protein [Rhodoferax sp.]